MLEFAKVVSQKYTYTTKTYPHMIFPQGGDYDGIVLGQTEFNAYLRAKLRIINDAALPFFIGEILWKI